MDTKILLKLSSMFSMYFNSVDCSTPYYYFRNFKHTHICPLSNETFYKIFYVGRDRILVGRDRDREKKAESNE